MTGGPHVWLAGPHDAEIIARLLVGFRNHLGYDAPSDNTILAGVDKVLDEHHSEFVLGSPDADSPPAGVVQLRYRWSVWRGAFDCLIEDVFVLESARGVGLGRALVEFACERAVESRGCKRAELDTNETNTAALGLYESLGFSAGRDGFTGRDLFMKRDLSGGGDQS